ncbi:hypothetical protein V2J09_015791 [Rumex salicifolius]
MASSLKFEIPRFNGTGNFALWQRQVKEPRTQQGMQKALLEEKPDSIKKDDWDEINNQERGGQKEKKTYGKNKKRSKSKAKKKAVNLIGEKQATLSEIAQTENRTVRRILRDLQSLQIYESEDSDMLSVTLDSHTDSWILDSGCSFHMTSHREWFETYKAGNLALKKNMISLGTLHVNGFIFRLCKSGAEVVVFESDNTTLWHMRMGHIKEHGLTELHKRGLLAGLKSCKMRFYKFCAMGEATKEALWIRGLVAESGVEQGGVQLHCDSQSDLFLAKNQVYHARTKRIDVRFHKIRELAASGEILLEKMHMSENPADILTKPVTVDKFKYCLDFIHVF